MFKELEAMLYMWALVEEDTTEKFSLKSDIPSSKSEKKYETVFD